MRMLIRYLSFAFILPFIFLQLAGSQSSQELYEVPIIPKPTKIVMGDGSFKSSSKTSIVIDKKTAHLFDVASMLVQGAREVTGSDLAVKKVPDPMAVKNSIVLIVDSTETSIGLEGYRLDVSSRGIIIKAPAPAGIFYGVQSLLQLLPQGKGKRWEIHAMTIEDRPRFQWRGMHLDVSRHFFSAKFIKTYIDMMAMHKMNVFHWHLTDDQGWRIQIMKYPKLTKVGAWRVNRERQNWNFRKPPRKGEKATYGGYYTQKEIREIVEYAKKRFITIVPEIEMPAHTVAALAAYPQYSCTGGPFLVPVGGYWPNSDIYCAGNDSTFTFIENILTEVMDLFPGKYIHIGGDEADKTEWKKCPRCQARIRENNLKDEGELQSYFIKRIEKFLVSKNRRLIGWDEILEGGLAPEATVMSWRGIDGGIAAARQNHDVVMTPTSYCYFDYYQGRQEYEPTAIGGYLPVSKVYSYEPIPDSLTPDQAKYILGAQANIWTEYIATPQHAQYMTMPRMAAMAEVVWSEKDQKNWEDFSGRLEHLLNRYRSKNYYFANSAFLVSFSTLLDSVTRSMNVALSSELGNNSIYYTTKGTRPTTSSHHYEKPFSVTGSSTINAGVVRGGRLVGQVTEQKIQIHKAAFRTITIKYPYEKYTGGGDYALVNMIRGTKSYDDGNWQGYHQTDLDVTIDLGDTVEINRISTSYLENINSWIFFPELIEYAISADGQNFTTVGRFKLPVPKTAREGSIREFPKGLNKVKSRYIQVRAKNVGICPDWHSGKGEKAWLFIDEVIVE